jgi:D-alanine-D-alanine ligase
MKLLTNKHIGVLMGGMSPEREVSLRSGKAILQALKRLGYRATTIDVGPDICQVLRRKKIDIAFLALHGGYGEDGSIQGMLEVLGMPYTGSGVCASAIAMDKEASKKIFQHHRIPVPPFKIMTGRKKVERPPFGLPWVIKPASTGSSVGVSIIKHAAGLGKALVQACAYGPRVIVEQYIEGKEVHIGILNNTVLGGVEVRPSMEFYSYEAKYTAGLTEYILPPRIGTRVYARAQAVALSAHRALGCRGATRVDLMISTKGAPYVLEVNTIPGMTETSLLPKIAGLAGLNFQELIEEILRGVTDEDK